MKQGNLVRVKESRHLTGKFPSFHGERTTYFLGTGVGIVLEIKRYDVDYGTRVHILTPRGLGWIWINPDEIEVIQ